MLEEFIIAGGGTIESLVEWADHPFVRALMLALGTFVSEDLACILGGVFAAQGMLGFTYAVGGCVLGIWVGDLLLYWLGRGVTSGALKWKWAKKRVTPERIARGHRFFERHGVKWIFLSRFLPGSRVVSYIAAGASGWSFSKFAVTLFIAALVWVPILVGAAYLAGEAVRGWLEFYSDYVWWILAGLVLLIWVLIKLVIPMFSWRGRRRLYGKWQRLTRWEYWPIWIVYLPVLFYLILLSIRYRAMCLFTASNPGIDNSGFVGDSKGEILDMLSTDPELSGMIASYLTLPKSGDAAERLVEISSWMSEIETEYPIVLKPDEGERGKGVEIIRNEGQALRYLTENEHELIAQRFISGPEYGVFYLRYPDEENGKIVSISQKHTQSIVGDGEMVLEDLILSDDRAAAMFDFYKKKFAGRLNEVLAKGEKIPLAEIGTHCRGAMFTDDRELLTDELEEKIDALSKSFTGFHIGRYDIRVSSVEDFQKGEGIQVLELNGVTAEPAHIYHPGFSYFEGVKTLCVQWGAAVKCGVQNRKRGHKALRIGQLIKLIREHEG